MLESLLRMLAIATLFVWATACGAADYNCSRPEIVNAAKELYLTGFTGIDLLKNVDEATKEIADTLRATYREHTKLRAIWMVENGKHTFICRAIIETPQLLSSCTDKDDASPACLAQERQLPMQLRSLLAGVLMAHKENSLLYIVEFTGHGRFILRGWKLDTIIASIGPP